MTERLEQEIHLLKSIITDLKRGGCWCDVGVSNPVMPIHSWACMRTQLAMVTQEEIQSVLDDMEEEGLFGPGSNDA